jgi:hypothetical protein
MFKGLITKTVKDMVVDPIMNPKTAPQDDSNTSAADDTSRRKSEFDPDSFDAMGGGGSFDPDSFDEKPQLRRNLSSTNSSGSHADPEEARRLIQEAWDVHLPFYPGDGASCGSSCECAWLLEEGFSREFGGQALLASWVVGGICSTCEDCLARASEWNQGFVRPVFEHE